MKRLIRSFLFVWFTIPLFSYAQPLQIQMYCSEDGLSQSSIHNFFQDPFGILWISTGDGINSFDGSSISSFFLPPIKNMDPSGNSFRNILADSVGNLWIGSDKGLYFLDRLHGEIKAMFPDSSELQKFATMPLFLTKDSLFVRIQFQGLLSINVHTKAYKLKKYPLSLSHLDFFYESDSLKMVGEFPNLVTSYSLINRQLDSTSAALPIHHLDLYQSIIPVSNSEFLIFVKQNVYSLAFRHGKLEYISSKPSFILPPDTDIKTAIRRKSGEIWLVSEQDELLIYRNNKLLQISSFVRSHPDEGKVTGIVKLFEDFEEHMWVGTDGYGFGMVNSGKSLFKAVRKFETRDSVFQNPFVRAFSDDPQGRLWVGTYLNGIYVKQANEQHFQQICFESSNRYPSYNDIYALESTGHEILAGTSRGLLIYQPETKQVIFPEWEHADGSIQRVGRILKLNDRHFLLLINKKLYELNHFSNHWIIEKTHYTDSLSIDCLVADKEIIYAFTYLGIMILQENSRQFVPYQFQGNPINIKVNHAVFQEDNTLWLATNTGLFEGNLKGEIRSQYTMKDGLPNHFLYSVLQDNQNRLWISSNGGLSVFNLYSRTFQNFNEEHGLQSVEFNTGAFFKAADSSLYFGGINGFNQIYPDSSQLEESYPILYLKKCYINDAGVSLGIPTIALQELKLSYSKNTISVEFEAVDFNKFKHHQFEYRLENYDDTWIFAGTNKLVRYSKLHPGTYTLIIRSIGDKMPGRQLKLLISIQKPFWKEWFIIIPFILLLSISFILIVKYISTRKMKKQILKLEQEKEIIQVKTRIASDLHDEIGSGLSKLAMMSDSIRMTKANSQDVESHLHAISLKARNMTDLLRTMVWTLDPQDDTIQGLLAYIRTKIAEFLEDREISLLFDVPDGIPPTRISAEFRRNVYYAVLEAVHNVVKHAGASQIQIQLILPGNQEFVLSICDDGIGFEPDQVHKFGHGLLGIRSRIKELNGSLSITSNQGTGTKICLKVPL